MEDVWVPIEDGYLNVWHRPGDGEAVVLLAGLTGNSRWWTHVIEHLPAELELMAIDVRGRAGSVDAPPPYDTATLAEDVRHVLDHFDRNQATIAGYSMGAWVASQFGILFSDRAKRIVLVDGGLEIPAPPGLADDKIAEAVVGPSLSRLDRRFKTQLDYVNYWKAHPALTDHWDDSMGPPLSYELEETQDGLRARLNPAAVAVSGRDITVDRELDSAASKTQLPLHIIVVGRGTADEKGGMIPLASALKAAASNSNITVDFFEDVNHYTLILGDGSKRVAAALADSS